MLTNTTQKVRCRTPSHVREKEMRRGDLLLLADPRQNAQKDSPAHLSHFFDFGASFSDEGAALAGWHDEP